MNTAPPILPGCSVLPPMDDDATRRPAPAKPSKAAKRKAAGRFAVLNTFIDFTMRDLPRAQLAVWLVLYRDARDGKARTSQVDIARRAGVDVRTVKRAIVQLERQGLLKIVHRGGLRRGPSTYRVHPLAEITGDTRVTM